MQFIFNGENILKKTLRNVKELLNDLKNCKSTKFFSSNLFMNKSPDRLNSSITFKDLSNPR
jgi:hypothetical protein